MSEKMRCPLRVAALDQPDTCDPNCAWLLRMANNENHRECAMTVRAVNNPHVAWLSVNHVEAEEER